MALYEKDRWSVAVLIGGTSSLFLAMSSIARVDIKDHILHDLHSSEAREQGLVSGNSR